MPNLIVTANNGLMLQPLMNPDAARQNAGVFIPSTTFTRGQTIGQITTAGATFGMLKAYASGNSDGSEVPIGWVMFDFVTDASSFCIYGSAGVTSDAWRGVHRTAPYWYRGTFLYADLSGMDTNAITVLQARSIGSGGTAGGSTGRYIIVP